MKLSKIIQRQIPAFIREMPALAGEKYNKFVAFIVRYYEFLETSFTKIGTTQGSKVETAPTVIEPPVGIPGSPGIHLKDGDYFLVTEAGFFSVGASGKKKTVYASAGKIIVFTKDGSSYVRSGEFFNFLSDKNLSSDNQLNIILKALMNEVAYNLPKDLIEEQLILQRIKELYTTKGSEEAYRFLFRVLFNKEIDFYYPSTSVLRTSDGQWNQEFSIFVRCIVGNPYLMIDSGADVLARKNKVALSVLEVEERTLLTGIFDSLDLGFIRETIQSVVDLGYTAETVDKIFDIGYVGSNYVDMVFEVSIDRDFYGTFKDNDVIVCRSDSGEVFIGYIVSTTTKAKVYSKGKGFRIGDLIPVDVDNGSELSATGTTLKVSGISTGGGIETLDFLTFGYEYSRPIVISATSEGEVKLLIEERAEKDDDLDFNTRMMFEDSTGGFISRGKSHVDMDYGLDEYCVINTLVTASGTGYTNATVTFSSSPNGITATGNAIISNGKIVAIDIVNPGNGYYIETSLAGTINTDALDDIILGTGTLFTEELVPGDLLYAYGIVVGRVKSIESDTELTLTSVPYTVVMNASVSGIRQFVPAVNITGNGTGATAIAYTGTELYWDIEYCGEVKSPFVYNRTKRVPDASEIALIRLYPGAVAKYPGYYQDNRGFLSDSIYLQDGRYYQDFSYVIKSEVPMNDYDSYVRTMLHPTGTMLFGEYEINNDISLDNVVSISSTFGVYLTIKVQDSVTSADVREVSTEVEYSYLHTVMDSASATDYGYVINDPYTLPYLPFASRMWEEYTIGDDFIEFGNIVISDTGNVVKFDSSSLQSGTALSSDGMTYYSTGEGIAGKFSCRSNQSRNSGKRYFEVTATNINTPGMTAIGIGKYTDYLSASNIEEFTKSDPQVQWIQMICTDNTGTFQIYKNGQVDGARTLPPMNEGDTFMVAVDFTLGYIWFGSNGVWAGVPEIGMGAAAAFTPNSNMYIYGSFNLLNVEDSITLNTGASTFVHEIPPGFVKWN